MYNNRHWASDVLVGAGIGTFAGLKVVRYHHSHPGNRLDRWLLAGSLSPTAGGGQALVLVDHARACRIHLHHAPPLIRRTRVRHA